MRSRHVAQRPEHMCHEHSKMVKTTLQVRSLRLDLSTGRLGSGPTARTSIIIWIEANDAHYLMSVGSIEDEFCSAARRRIRPNADDIVNCRRWTCQVLQRIADHKPKRTPRSEMELLSHIPDIGEAELKRLEIEAVPIELEGIVLQEQPEIMSHVLRHRPSKRIFSLPASFALGPLQLFHLFLARLGLLPMLGMEILIRNSGGRPTFVLPDFAAGRPRALCALLRACDIAKLCAAHSCCNARRCRLGVRASRWRAGPRVPQARRSGSRHLDVRNWAADHTLKRRGARHLAKNSACNSRCLCHLQCLNLNACTEPLDTRTIQCLAGVPLALRLKLKLKLKS